MKILKLFFQLWATDAKQAQDYLHTKKQHLHISLRRGFISDLLYYQTKSTFLDKQKY